MPQGYNVYGLGEHIHPLRLGNNFSSTLWNVDIPDPVNGKFRLFVRHKSFAVC